MNFDLSEDQAALHEAIANIVESHAELARTGPTVQPSTYSYGEALDRDLQTNGFYDIAREEGLGALEAGLLIAEVARSPHVVETVASALIVPLMFPELDLPRPIALARAEDLTRAVRFLDRAKTVLVDAGDRICILPVDSQQVEEVGAHYAYPLGRFRTAPDLTGAQSLGGDAVGTFRRLWSVGVALEIAGATRAAHAFTVQYVKDRRIFGRPLGGFQAVQHRLAADVPLAEGVYWLGLRAAWSGTKVDASTALLHAQEVLNQVIFDLHQFNGALGFTLEHSLHFWTQRLRLLQGELGGSAVQAETLADAVWPD